MAGISILPYETIPTGKYNIANKQNKLISGENIKTINGETILGAGDLDITPDVLKSFITIAPLSNSRAIIDAFNKYSLNKKLGTLIPTFIKKESFDKDYTLAILVVEDYTKVSAGYRLTFTLLGAKTNAKSSDMESIYSPDVFSCVRVLSYLYSESMGYVIPLGEGEIKDRKMLEEAKRYVDAEIQKLDKQVSESLEDVGISEETVAHIISTVQSSVSDDIENISKQVENINKQVENINSNNITPIIKISYDSLVQLKNNASLIPGQQYRIIDYITTTSQQGTFTAYHPFDIIVTADSESTLNENARAIQNEEVNYFADSNLDAWELKYCLDNDTDRFAWADTTNGKGVIYYMKDEWNNECPYDFKNILIADSYNDVYTFGGDSDATLLGKGLVANNVIKPIVNRINYRYRMTLPIININLYGNYPVVNNVFTGSYNVHITCDELRNSEFTNVSNCNITVPHMDTNVFKAFNNVLLTGNAVSYASFIHCAYVTVELTADLSDIEISLSSNDMNRPKYVLSYSKSPSKRKVWLDSNGNLASYCEDDLINRLLNN